ncbi:MAG: DUF4145 domain-containing protein [Rhizobiaceae bacterium]|nr:DUF4145 domain-containing protein [Rhizobiaceae bacterium]MCV0407228.1 DUF4145 domain-containing protein [Rhizobiaceae bacterium]
MTSPPRRRLTEEFLLRFSALREATKYEPRRLLHFYSQSANIKEASDALFWFMVRTQLEWRIDHGKRIHVGLPDHFRAHYADFKQHWREAINDVSGIRGALNIELPEEYLAKPIERVAPKPTEPPDYGFDVEFDPRIHNAGQVMDAGIGYLADKAEDDGNDDYIRNLCRIAVEGSDYLASVIGIDFTAASERFRRIPVTIVPGHIAPGNGPGTLAALLDEAILAYVVGAPNAAIAMCRAVLERLLKVHYGRGEIGDKDLNDLIDFCARNHAWVKGRKKPLHDLRRLANRALHTSSVGSKLSSNDEEILISAFGNLKFLIEKAPAGRK